VKRYYLSTLFKKVGAKDRLQLAFWAEIFKAYSSISTAAGSAGARSTA
jgi:hypothetical protein